LWKGPRAGASATWFTGVRTFCFTAHAWIEANGQLGSDHTLRLLPPIITIPHTNAE
jgi:hypothetical protein